MLKINYTLFIQIANFLLLLFIMNILLYRPIRKILGRRTEEMDSFQKMIEDFQNNSTRDEKELEENMAGARKEGYKEKESHKNEGLEEEKEMLQDATSLAGEKINKAKEETGHKIMDAHQSLESDMEIFSRELAEKVMGRSV